MIVERREHKLLTFFVGASLGILTALAATVEPAVLVVGVGPILSLALVISLWVRGDLSIMKQNGWRLAGSSLVLSVSYPFSIFTFAAGSWACSMILNTPSSGDILLFGLDSCIGFTAMALTLAVGAETSISIVNRRWSLSGFWTILGAACSSIVCAFSVSRVAMVWVGKLNEAGGLYSMCALLGVFCGSFCMIAHQQMRIDEWRPARK